MKKDKFTWYAAVTLPTTIASTVDCFRSLNTLVKYLWHKYQIKTAFCKGIETTNIKHTNITGLIKEIRRNMTNNNVGIKIGINPDGDFQYINIMKYTITFLDNEVFAPSEVTSKYISNQIRKAKKHLKEDRVK